MTPDQDLRMSCVELAQDVLGGDGLSNEVVARARAYYRFIVAHGEKGVLTLVTDEIPVKHRILAEVIQEEKSDAGDE
jgi:hypothetical protein